MYNSQICTTSNTNNIDNNDNTNKIDADAEGKFVVISKFENKIDNTQNSNSKNNSSMNVNEETSIGEVFCESKVTNKIYSDFYVVKEHV
jgi:hypothetical protein